MALAPTCHCEEGMPEWIMSYADMITILMAFFVVMYSLAGSKDEQQEEALLRALRKQFGHFANQTPGKRVLANSLLTRMPIAASPGGAKEENSDDPTRDKGQAARLPTLRHDEPIAVGGAIVFPDDQAELSEDLKFQLQATARELAGKPQRIEVRGFTSRRPLRTTSSWRDPWELTFARCRATADYLTTLGIDQARLRISVAGPIPAGQLNGNRFSPGKDSRVEVFMLSEFLDQFPSRSP